MDARRFDALARILSTPNTRRRLLGLLAAVPLLGGLPGWLDPEESAAKDRRRRRKGRHKTRQDKAKGKRKRQKRQRACKPLGKAAVCAGTCGPVTSRQTCGKSIDCGSCACNPACDPCHTCQDGPNTPGACVPDPAQVGDPCGAPGQVCASDGTCTCTATSCTDCEECGGDGVCTGCSGCCDAGACVATCPQCTICDDKQCLPCPGCCDGSGACQDGDRNAACGPNGGVCEICTAPQACGGGGNAGVCGCTATTCAAEGKDCGQIDDGCGVMLDCGSCGGSTPICINNVCTACTSHDQCGAGKICNAGSCTACTVTCDAADHTCSGTALQTALGNGGTVVVCPGLYTGLVSVAGVATVTMVGAGDGDDPATNTLLRDFQVSNVTTFAMSHVRVYGYAAGACAGHNGIYIKATGATLTDCAFVDIGPKTCTSSNGLDTSTVEMVDCLVTGGYRYDSGGLSVWGGALTLRGSTISDNFTPSDGGGINAQSGAVVKVLDGTVITGNTGGDGGGIYAAAGVTVTISADSSVTGNKKYATGVPSNCAGGGTFNGTCGP